MNNPLEPSPGCIQNAISIVGNKWTALIIRDLSTGPKRFGELQNNINLNPRTLSKRLDDLNNHEIIELANPMNTTYHSYRLTRKGEDLLPILQKMAEWGNKYPCDSSATTA